MLRAGLPFGSRTTPLMSSCAAIFGLKFGSFGLMPLPFGTPVPAPGNFALSSSQLPGALSGSFSLSLSLFLERPTAPPGDLSSPDFWSADLHPQRSASAAAKMTTPADLIGL